MTKSTTTATRTQRRTTLTAFVLFGLVGVMIGLAFASVPLYRLFCQVTGFGGTPRVAAANTVASGSGREITVRFDANVNSALPWRFKPVQRKLDVRVGESTLAHYTAENLSDDPVSGSATFNVTPYKAAPYFVKVACFCFDEQKLEAGQTMDMPVSFYIDPEILNDINTRDVDTITLSYTFFRSGPQAAPAPAEARAAVAKTAAPQG